MNFEKKLKVKGGKGELIYNYLSIAKALYKSHYSRVIVVSDHYHLESGLGKYHLNGINGSIKKYEVKEELRAKIC